MDAGRTPRPTPKSRPKPGAGADPLQIGSFQTPPDNPCQSSVDAWASSLPLDKGRRIGVAFSGGADSTALLLAVATHWPNQVAALHVNHGMQPAAESFEQHCQAFCADRAIPFHVAHLHVRPLTGESPEDAARQARYAALAELCSKYAIENVALAQHADDQIETILLALTRGAGLRGLAAMPAMFMREGVQFHRPVLSQSGAVLREWLTQSGTPYVVDPSNANEALTRNRIRHQLLPVLASAFPAFRQTFARTARHAAQAQTLLNQLAELDVRVTEMPPAIKALQTLAPERQVNLLRYWLANTHQVAPSEAQLMELLKQVAACTTRGHRINLKIADGVVQRVEARLQYFPGS